MVRLWPKLWQFSGIGQKAKRVPYFANLNYGTCCGVDRFPFCNLREFAIVVDRTQVLRRWRRLLSPRSVSKNQHPTAGNPLLIGDTLKIRFLGE